jgi:hypothetical protein
MGRGLRAVLIALAFAPLPAEGAEVALSFSDAPGGASGGFRIERREAGAKRFEVIALVGPGVADFVDRGLPVGASYCYRVRALAAEASSSWSPEVCAESKEAPPAAEETAPVTAPSEGEVAAPAEGSASQPAGAAPGSEPGRRIRTSGGWLQVLD